jgi:DNA-binding transcriptional ArsR family regulator
VEPQARLAVLKALGDNTRYAIYLELARSASPRSTIEIAETLALHPNTVRPHLERMREVGLLDVEVENRGSVGRPQHRYSLAADAPSLGLEPAAFPLLSRLLAEVHPELVCHLHRGLVEGFVEEHGGAGVERFGTIVDREPCQVVLSLD